MNNDKNVPSQKICLVTKAEQIYQVVKGALFGRKPKVISVAEAKQFYQAVLLTFISPRPKVDALFIHGSPANRPDMDRALLSLATNVLQHDAAEYIVLNGLSDSDCKEKLAYPGCDTWKSILHDLGVEDSKILTIPPSEHTAAESRELLILAKERRWKSVSIASFPHHLLRCFAQMIYFINREGSDIKVYPRTTDSAPWFSEAKKTVLNGGLISGNLIDHADAEFDRLYTYGNQNVPLNENGKPAYTPNALPSDIIDYCMKRDL